MRPTPPQHQEHDRPHGEEDSHTAHEGRADRDARTQRLEALDDFKAGYSYTAAPIIAKGLLLTGVSGGEFGIRGFIDGTDLKTGKQVWRTHTIPGPGEPGHDRAFFSSGAKRDLSRQAQGESVNLRVE